MEASTKNKSRKIIVDSEEEEKKAPGIPTSQDNDNTANVSESNDIPRPVSSSIKREKKPRTAGKKNIIEDAEKYCFDVINEMKDLYKKDLQLNEQQKPAQNKIENIDRVCSKIIRKDVQEVFLQLGILKELRLWLEPLPDNTLPNQKIKRAILDLLEHMRVNKADLMSSGIGKIVHFYSKNSKESPEIRKMAISIVKKWKAKIIKEDMLE